MTNKQTRDVFINALMTNSYINMCNTDDMENAIKALEKQIPKEPINIKWVDGNISHADCPSCGYSFPDIGGVWEAYDEVEQYEFCPECGQKINWKELKNQ